MSILNDITLYLTKPFSESEIVLTTRARYVTDVTWAHPENQQQHPDPFDAETPRKKG